MLRSWFAADIPVITSCLSKEHGSHPKSTLRCHRPSPASLAQQAWVSCSPQTAKAAFYGGGGISKLIRKFPKGSQLPVSRRPGEGRVSRHTLQHSTDISGLGDLAAAIISSPERALPFPQLFFLGELKPLFTAVWFVPLLAPSSPRLSLQSRGPAGTLFTPCSWC